MELRYTVRKYFSLLYLLYLLLNNPGPSILLMPDTTHIRLFTGISQGGRVQHHFIDTDDDGGNSNSSNTKI